MRRQLTFFAICAAGSIALTAPPIGNSFAQDQNTQDRDTRPSLLDQIKQRAEEEARKKLQEAVDKRNREAGDAATGNGNAPPTPTPTPTPPPSPVPTRTVAPSPSPAPVRTRTSPQRTSPTSAAAPALPVPKAAIRPEDDDRPIIMRDADLPLYAADQILLFLHGQNASADPDTVSSGLTIIRSQTIEVLGVTMITANIAAGDSVENTISRLEGHKAIAWVQPNYIYQLLGNSSGANLRTTNSRTTNSRTRGLAIHGLDGASALLPQGLPAVNPAAKIVLIDSPVDIRHESFVGASITQNNVPKNSPPSPHGTAIAELLIGNGDFGGVAKGAQLISIPAFWPTDVDDWHAPSTSTTDYLVAALEQAQALRPNVMNLSFGSPTDRDDGVGKMLQRIYADGVCIAAAAGNGGADSHVRFPAMMDETIAVAAVNTTEAPYTHGSRGPQVDIAAWGVDINAAVPGGRRPVTGTSFAAPLVAGAMLRMPACVGAARPAAVRAALAQDAKDLGDNGRDVIFGAGLLRFGEGALASATLAQAAIEAAEIKPVEPDSGVSPLLLGGGAATVAAGMFFLAWRRRRKRSIEP